MKKALLATLVLALAAAGAWWWWWHAVRTNGETVRYRLANVERGPIEVAVAASGTVNAVSTVQVGAPIPGQVKEIYADFNTPVKKGQVIARLDATSYELRVNQARADLDAAQGAVAALRSSLAAEQTDLGRAAAAVAAASATSSASARWRTRASSRRRSSAGRARPSTRPRRAATPCRRK